MFDVVEMVERRWQFKLPSDLREILCNTDGTQVPDLLTAEMLSGEFRCPLMLPQLFPVAVSTESSICLYLPFDEPGTTAWYVLVDLEDAVCRPAGRTLRELVGTRTALEEDVELASTRSVREAMEMLAAAYPQSTAANCLLACSLHDSGDDQSALDHLAAANEAAPWHSDALCLMAEINLAAGRTSEAMHGYWEVLQRNPYLCGATGWYSLFEDLDDIPITVAATERLLDLRPWPHMLADTPLGRYLMNDDPASIASRTALAHELAALGDIAGAERELVTALRLGAEVNQPKKPLARLREFYLAHGRDRDAMLCEYG